MLKTRFGGWLGLMFCGVIASSVGCSKTDKNTGGAGTGAAGTGAGTGSVDAGTVVDMTPLNPDCPTAIGPLMGPYAMKGACCYRTGNKARNQNLPDGAEATVEYRASYNVNSNHPMTLDVATLISTAISRGDNEEQSLLFRFKGKRSSSGDPLSGMTSAEIGQGRYNCDGTYSFYGDSAAPSRMLSSDAKRWKSTLTPTITDASKMGADQTKPVWSMTYRGISYTPYVNATTFALEWELITRGLSFTEIETGAAHQDCIGERKMSDWAAGAKFETYTPLEDNDKDTILALTQTFCELISFGPGLAQDDMHSCKKTKRCKPGSAGCTWLKLPDSLCPTTPDEEKIFGCHVGDMNNDDKVVTNCTMTAPTTPLDATKDPKVSQGQCCDPLGESTTLPACNANRLVEDVVLSAVDITDAPSNTLQADCHPM